MGKPRGEKERKRSRFRKRIRPYVLRRDKFRCRLCAVRVCLTVHHIEKFACIYKDTDKLYDFSNMVTLCSRCHRYAPNGKEAYDDWERRFSIRATPPPSRTKRVWRPMRKQHGT